MQSKTRSPTLHQTTWPTQHPKAIIIALHGLGSHSQTFTKLATHLTHHHYTTHAPDLPGHGHTPGLRGHIPHWTHYRQTLHTYLTPIQTQHPSLPLIGIGHSLGSIILLDYILHHPKTFSAAILIAPPLGPSCLPPHKRLIGYLLSNIWPQFRLPTGIPPSTSFRNPDLLQAHLNDPLRHNLGSARLATEFERVTQQIQDTLQNHPTDIPIPLLILHGSQDRIAHPSGSITLLNTLCPTEAFSCDHTLKTYPDGYHHLHQDDDAEAIATDIANWLNQTLA